MANSLSNLKHTLPSGEKKHWIDGKWVEHDALRIAERVNEYDPNLFVQYLERAAAIGDAPFRVVYRNPQRGLDQNNAELYTVLYAWQLDERLLDRIRAADSHRFNVLGKLELDNEKLVTEGKRRYFEIREENKAKVASVLASRKTEYTLHNDKDELVRISDHKPREKVKRTRRAK